jgi:predicted nucleotidyltransferase
VVHFREFLRRLKENEVEFIVIGGVAASLLGSPLPTLDVDVCAPMDDRNLERILNALRDVRPRLRMRPDKMPLPDSVDRLRGIKNIYVVTDIGPIDLLNEVPGIGTYHELSDKTVELDVGGFTCRVLDLDTLIASKKIAARPKDHAAVMQLEAIKRVQDRDRRQNEQS